MVSQRELGNIAARLDHIEAEILTLRNRSHAHASALTPALALVSVVKTMQERIDALERGRDRLALFVGACAGAGGIIGFCLKWLIDRFG